MHPSFADWYRPLLTQPDEKFLKSRWDLVEATATNLSIPLALELLRLSFGLPNQDDEAIAGMKKQLKPDGMNYARATAHLELALVGDCVLLQSFEQAKSKLTWSHVVLACALLCQQSVRPTLQRPIQSELLQRARVMIDQFSVRMRKTERAGLSSISVQKWPEIADPPLVTDDVQQQRVQGSYIDTTVSFKIPKTSQLNQLAASVVDAKKSIIAITTKIDQTSNAVNSIFNAINASISAPQEENNIHWYLLGETSRDLHRRFSSFEVPELTLVAAKELADLTETAPGLYAALAFLDRILGHGRLPAAISEPISIGHAISASQPLWKEKGIQVLGFEATQDFTPILYSLSFATTGDMDWRTLTPQLCRVDLNTKMSPLLISYQFYQEILLSRLARQHLAGKGTK